jgi:hypothetical protein
VKATPAADKATYLVDPENWDDANPAGKPWKTFGCLNIEYGETRAGPGPLRI